MKRLILKAIGVCAVLLPGLPAQAANLLANAGFVPSNTSSYLVYTVAAPPGWTNLGASNGPMAFDLVAGLTQGAVSPLPAYNGNAFMYDLGGFGNPRPRVGDGIRQTFATLPGHRYRLTFGHNAEAAGSALFDTGTDSLRVQVGGQDITFASPYDQKSSGYGQACCAWQGAWVSRSVVFTASDSSTSLQFSVASVSTNSYGSGNLSRNSANSQIVAGPVVEEIILAPTLLVKKALGDAGRISNADQFTVSIQKGGLVQNSNTASSTTGSGSTVDAGTGTTGVFTAVAGTSYALGETLAAQSASHLGQYSASVQCTNSGVDGTDVSTVRTLDAPFTVSGNDVIACTITNTPKPVTLSIRQLVQTPLPVNLQPPFSFGYTGNNGWQLQTLKSLTLNTLLSGTAQTLSALNTATTLAVTLPEPRWRIGSFSCVDTNAAVTGNPTGTLVSSTVGSVTIPAAYVRAGSTLRCTVMLGHSTP